MCNLFSNSFISLESTAVYFFFFLAVHRTVFSQCTTMHTVIFHLLSQRCNVPTPCPSFSPGSANRTPLCGYCEQWVVPGSGLGCLVGQSCYSSRGRWCRAGSGPNCELFHLQQVASRAAVGYILNNSYDMFIIPVLICPLFCSLPIKCIIIMHNHSNNAINRIDLFALRL